MNENEDYTHVQRRLCAVMAKSEWTSSRMRMQKSGEELRERRAKSNRSANKFLQDLLDKRTDSDLIDDNGVVDRYNKFVKYKSALNDDTNSSLDEFDRRLRALNNNRRNQIHEKKQQQQQQHLKNSVQSTIEGENDKKQNIQVHSEDRHKSSRKLPTISGIRITSTPNDTTSELTNSASRDNEIQELSSVKSMSLSFIDSQANHIESYISQHHASSSSSLDKTETLNSPVSSLNNLLTPTLYAPKACRPDGTEIIVSSSISPLPEDSSNVLLFNHCYFPRSLTSRGKINPNSILKRQLPTLPTQQSTEFQSEQFDTNQLYDFLDHLDNKSQQYSHNDFINMLDQLTLSTVIHNNHEQINNNNLSTESLSYINNEEEENILPNLFDQSSLTQEKLFYTTLNINIDDPANIFLYTMTLSTVQLSASILLPYSMINGRRPLLQCSKQTHFKQIHSKQKKYTCQVTAVESSLNIPQIQQNDIILKINDQSVWGLTTDAISDILKQDNNCSLTVARLCQPFV